MIPTPQDLENYCLSDYDPTDTQYVGNGTISPSTPGYDNGCKPILNHLAILWCGSNLATYQYVISWLARMVQAPMEPAPTVLILHGTGVDRTLDILMDPITAMMKSQYTTCLEGDITLPVFTHAPRDPSALELLEILGKPLYQIPNPGDPSQFRTFKNCLHIIKESDEPVEHPLFFNTLVDDHMEGDEDYLQRLANFIIDGGLVRFLAYLRSLDVSDFDPTSMPTPDHLKICDII